MTSAPMQEDVSGRQTAVTEPAASAANALPAHNADVTRVQALHEAVEAARRFGLLQENF